MIKYFSLGSISNFGEFHMTIEKSTNLGTSPRGMKLKTKFINEPSREVLYLLAAPIKLNRKK